MARVCFLKSTVEQFKKDIKSGKINPNKLKELSSAERRALFEKNFGEEGARYVNALFEKNILLKNQQNAMISWAKQIVGLKESSKRDLISKIERIEGILQPADVDAFLNDFVSQKLGFDVSVDSANTIVKMTNKVKETRDKVTPEMPNGSKERIEYGRALHDLKNFIDGLKLETNKKTIFQRLKTPQGVARIVSDTAGLAKSLKASLDNSVIGRQGWKTMVNHPSIWAKNSLKSFVDMARVFGGKEVLSEVRAEAWSRKNALNGLYEKEGLNLGVVEEAYPTSLPERFPGIGRAFKASQEAFTAWQVRTRADVFDKLVDMAEKTGADTNGLGELVNSLTGRGSLGRAEIFAKDINNVFFSFRLLRSNFDALTAHVLSRDFSPFVRKQAAVNTLRNLSAIASIIAITNAFGGKAEVDPRSPDFGKIRVGNTRFDVTGGIPSLLTLASRIATKSVKSSTTGKITDIETGKYGSTTFEDLATNFFENKLSPAAGMILHLYKGKDFKGDKTTALNELVDLFKPLPIANYQELSENPNSANIILAMIADALGFGTNTYSNKK